jgi:hypothetical protein
METKICSKCGETKSIDDFSKRKASKDGYQPLCKTCKKEYNTQWAVEDKDSPRRPNRNSFFNAKKRSKKTGVPFTITESGFIVPEICPILGIKLEKGRINGSLDTSPSLDKIRPELGYVPGNIAVISYRANRIKNDGTAEEHRKIADWMDAQLKETPNVRS